MSRIVPVKNDQLSRETVKLAHFLAAMQERLNSLRERAKAQGKAS
jgi:hypothetical protein